MIAMLTILGLSLLMWGLNILDKRFSTARKNQAIADAATAKAIREDLPMHVRLETRENGWIDMFPSNFNEAGIPIYIAGQYLGRSNHVTEFVAYMAFVNRMVKAGIIAPAEAFLVYYLTPLVDNDKHFITKYPQALTYISDDEQGWKDTAYSRLPDILREGKDVFF